MPVRVVAEAGAGVQIAAGLARDNTGRIMGYALSSLGRLSAVVVAFGALASCATLNEDECLNADWYRLGQEDGAAGKPASHIDNHRKACGEHGLPVDAPQWSVGWEQGIRAFCTPDNGLIQGREGRYYANSCPPDVKAGFDGAYSVAKALYDARASRDRLQGEIDGIEASLRKATARDEMAKLQAELDRKRDDLRIAERRLWDAEGDYDLYVRVNGLRR